MVLFFPFLTSYAQLVRKYSNEFMSIGVDAASFAMSNTLVGSSADVNSAYWNPAGLSQINDTQIAVMHANYFANIAKYDYIAYATTIDPVSSFAISMIRFGVDDIMDTTELIDSEGNVDYNRISLFSTSDYGFTFSYGRKSLVKGLRYGANAKIIRRIIGDFASSWGCGFDVGVQYKHKNWFFGIMLRDITTTYNIWNINEAAYKKISDAQPDIEQEKPETTEITPPKTQFGMAKKFIFAQKYSLLSAISFDTQFVQTEDIISSKNISISPAVGVEIGYTNLVFLRGGIGNFQKALQIDNTTETIFQPNMGLGFKYKGIQIDYALTNLGNQEGSLYSNIFSIKIDFSFFRK